MVVPFANQENEQEFKELKLIPSDFEEIMEVLISRIKSRLPNKWQDFLTSNFGIELIEVFSYEAAQLIYLINRNINEVYMPTARTKYGIYNLARNIGYIPRTCSPSRTKCLLTIPFDNPNRNNISIPKYTKLSTQDNKMFYIENDYILPSGQSQIEVDVVAGSIIQDTFISNGIPRYPYKTNYFPVSFIESVKVNGDEFQYSEYLDMLGPESVYTVEYDKDNYGKIIFGDGIYGLNPLKDSEIVVLYNINLGENSNTSAYSINRLIDPIYDMDDKKVNCTITNPNAAIGGDREESCNEIRRNSPSIFRTQWRTVTKQDFKDTLRSEPGIEKLIILDRSDMDEIGIYGVKIGIIPTEGGYINDSFKNHILNILENRRLLTTDIQFIHPEYVQINLDVTISKKDSINAYTVKTKLQTELFNYLHWRNRNFGNDVTVIDLYRIIGNIEGVTFADNLKIELKKCTYISENLKANRTEKKKIQVIDSMSILKPNMSVQILDNKGSLICNNVIDKIEGSLITMKNNMNYDFEYGNQIYPVLIVKSNINEGSKTVQFETDYSNLNDTVIYFENKPDKYYTIRFKTLNGYYLDEEIKYDIPEGTKTFVVSKDVSPRLEFFHNKGASSLTFTNNLRFVSGAVLYKESNSDVKYYVKNVVNNTAFITPSLIEDVKEYEKFIYESDSLNLYQYEIADCGKININIVNA
jgi:hypothetical protein